MNVDTALGWMTVRALNEHFPHPDHREEWAEPDAPDMGTGGCVQNCGVCGALHALDREGRAGIETYIRLTGYTEGGWDWWDSDNDRLRWDVLEAYWAGHISCGWTDGKPTGCGWNEDDDDDEDVTS